MQAEPKSCWMYQGPARATCFPSEPSTVKRQVGAVAAPARSQDEEMASLGQDHVQRQWSDSDTAWWSPSKATVMRQV